MGQDPGGCAERQGVCGRDACVPVDRGQYVWQSALGEASVGEEIDPDVTPTEYEDSSEAPRAMCVERCVFGDSFRSILRPGR